MVERQQNSHAAHLNHEGNVHGIIIILQFNENKRWSHIRTTTKTNFVRNCNTCGVNDPVVLSVVKTGCEGSLYLPIIVIDLSKAKLLRTKHKVKLEKYKNEKKKHIRREGMI